MQTRHQAAFLEEPLTDPDQSDARQDSAVNSIKDKDATRSQHARNLFGSRIQVLHMLQHIQADNNREAPIGIGQRFSVALFKIRSLSQPTASCMIACRSQSSFSRINADRDSFPLRQLLTDQATTTTHLQHLLLSQRLPAKDPINTGLDIITALSRDSMKEIALIPPAITGKYLFLRMFLRPLQFDHAAPTLTLYKELLYAHPRNRWHNL